MLITVYTLTQPTDQSEAGQNQNLQTHNRPNCSGNRLTRTQLFLAAACHNLDIVCRNLYLVSHNLDITPNNPEPIEAGLVPNLDPVQSGPKEQFWSGPGDTDSDCCQGLTSCRLLTPPEQTSRRSLPDFRSRSSTGVTVLEILRVRQGRSRNLEQQEQLLQDTWTGNPTSPVT